MRYHIANSRPFGRSKKSRKKYSKRTGRRLLMEPLEDRRLLAVTELAPEADALVYQYSPTTNYGTFANLYAANGTIESYLRFNLAEVNGSVTKATLLLQPNYVSGGGNGLLHLANDNWDEFEITWNNQPGYDAVPIASWTAVINTQLSIDVTNTVQSQTGDGAVSFYLSDAGSSNYVIFDSKESVSTQYHPRLVVETSGGSTNRAPVAVNDSRSVNEDTDLTINVLANDSDPDGDAISLQSFTQAANGTVTQIGTQLKYRAAQNFYGSDSFTYTIADGRGGTDTATVFMTVNSVNDAPTISNITDQVTNKNTAKGPIAFTVGDVETATTSLVVTATSSNPALLSSGGIVLGGSAASRTITMTPMANQSGSTTVTVSVRDADYATTTETFVLTVNPGDGGGIIELTPEADALVYGGSPTTNYGTFSTLYAYSGNIESYLRFNLAAVSGDVTNATLVLQPYYSYAGSGLLYAANDNWDEMAITWSNQPGHASQPLTSWTVTPYTPLEIDVTNAVQAEMNDGLASFYLADAGPGNYSIFYSDENGTPQYRPRLVITTGGGSTNRAPVAVNDSRSVNEDTDITINVLANDSDPDGDALNLQSFTQAANGTVTQVGTQLKYRAAPNFYGSDSFTYTIVDGQGGSDTGTVFMTVNAINDAPTISDIANQVTNEDTTKGPITFTVSDVETATTSLVVTATSSNTSLLSSGGIALGGSGASRTITMTPAANQYGSTTVTLSVRDANNATTTDTFVLTVNSVNDGPTISNITNQVTNEDTAKGPVAFTVGDVETATTSLVVTATSSNTALLSSGGIALGGSGANRTITMTPSANQYGSTIVTVSVRDANNLATSDTFVLTVNSINDLPIAINDAVEVDENDQVTIAVLANDTDPDGDPLNLQSFTQAANGTVIQVGNQLKYTPRQAYTGSDAFSYVVTDGRGGSQTAIVSITVNLVEEPGETVVLTPEADALIHGYSSYRDRNYWGSSAYIYAYNLGSYELASFLRFDLQQAAGAVTKATLVLHPWSTFSGNGLIHVAEDNWGEQTVTWNNQPSHYANGISQWTAQPNSPVEIDVTTSVQAQSDGLVSFWIAGDEPGNYMYFHSRESGTVQYRPQLILELGHNDPPYANPVDYYGVNEDRWVNVHALDGASDPDGDTLSVASFTQASHGTVTRLANPDVLRYTPDPDFNGSDVFTYTISDGRGGTDVGTVSMTVRPVNDPPLPTGGRITTLEDTAYTFRLSDFGFTDADGDSIVRIKVRLLSRGELYIDSSRLPSTPQTTTFLQISDIENGRLTYRPGQDEHGIGYSQLAYSLDDATTLNKSLTPEGIIDIDVTEVAADLFIRLEAVDTLGTPVTTVPVGSSFFVNAYVRDGRSINADGVFAAYMDILYDASRVTATGTRFDTGIYQNNIGGDLRRAGLVNEVGAYAARFEPLDGQEYRVFRVEFTATASGPVTFRPDQARDLGHELLRFGENVPVPPSSIDFSAASIQVVASGGAASASADSSVSAAPVAAQSVVKKLNTQADAGVGFGAAMMSGSSGEETPACVGATVSITPNSIEEGSGSGSGSGSGADVRIEYSGMEPCLLTITVTEEVDAFSLSEGYFDPTGESFIFGDYDNSIGGYQAIDVYFEPGSTGRFNIYPLVDADDDDETVIVQASNGGSAILTITEPDRSSLMIAQERDATEPSQWYTPAGGQLGLFTLEWSLVAGATAPMSTTVTLKIDDMIDNVAYPGDYGISAFDNDSNELDITYPGNNLISFDFSGASAKIQVTAIADPPDKNTGTLDEEKLDENVRLVIESIATNIPYRQPTSADAAQLKINDRDELVIRAERDADEQGPQDGEFVVEPAESGKRIATPFTLKIIDANLQGHATPGADFAIYRVLPSGVEEVIPLIETGQPGEWHSLNEIDPLEQTSIRFLVRPADDDEQEGAETVTLRILEIEGRPIQDDLEIKDNDIVETTMVEAKLEVPESAASDCSCSCSTCAADGILVELHDGTLTYIPTRSSAPIMPTLTTNRTHGVAPMVRAELKRPTAGWPAQITVGLSVMDDNDTPGNPTRTSDMTLVIPSGFTGSTLAITVPANFSAGDFSAGSYDIMLDATDTNHLYEWEASASHLIRDLRRVGALAPAGATGNQSVPGATFPLKQLVTGETKLDKNGISQDAVALFRSDNSASWYLGDATSGFETPAETLSDLSTISPSQVTELSTDWTAFVGTASPTFQYALTDRYGMVDYFDAGGRQVATYDQNGNATLFRYDGSGRLAAITDPLGRKTDLLYDAVGRLSTIRDFASRETRFEYAGNTLTIVQPDPDLAVNTSKTPTELITFDASGLILSANRTETTGSGVSRYVDGPQRSVSVAYDEWGSVDSVTRKDLSFGTPDGNLLSMWTLAEYPQAEATPVSVSGILTWNLSPTHTVRKLEDFPDTALVRDGNQNETLLELDTRGRTLKATDALNHEFFYTRTATDDNDRGDVTNINSPAPVGVSGTINVGFGYDNRSNVISQTLPSIPGTPNQLTWPAESYDTKFSVPRVVNNELGHKTEMALDAQGNITQVRQFDPLKSGSQPNPTAPWQNPRSGSGHLDVDNSNFIVPLDVLVLINDINLKGPRQLPAVRPAGETLYLDPTGDNYISPLDVLVVINRLNSVGSTQLPQDDVADAVLDNVYTDGTAATAVNIPKGLLHESSVTTARSGGPITTHYEYYGVGDDGVVRGNAAFGLLESVTYDGNSTGYPNVTYFYDSHGNVARVRELVEVKSNVPAYRETEFTYDRMNRLTSVLGADPDGSDPLLPPLTKYQYDAYGNVSKVEVVNQTFAPRTTTLRVTAHITQYSYDGMNRLTSVSEQGPGAAVLGFTTVDQLRAYRSNPMTLSGGSGPVTHYAYDKNSNLTSVIDAEGRTTTYHYDALNRLTEIVEPAVNESHVLVDGQRLNTNPMRGEVGGPITTYTYDAVGNIETLTDALGQVTRYEYDAWSRLKKVTQSSVNGKTPVTTMAYEPVPGTAADGTTVYQGWRTIVTDAEGNSTSDPNDRRTITDYDFLGRVLSVTEPKPNASSPAPTTRFAYYPDGSLRWMQDAEEMVTSYAYDTRGRLGEISRNHLDGVPHAIPKTSYAYDQANQIVSMTDPLGVTSYEYDALGRQIKIMPPDPDGAGPETSPLMTYQYDAVGNVLQVTDALNHATTYGYDELFRPKTERDAVGKLTSFGYDRVGNRVSLTDPNQNTTRWQHDRLDRVYKELNPFEIDSTPAEEGTRTFKYDAVGNLRETIDRNGRKTTYGYDALYRMTQEQWFASASDPSADRTLAFGYDLVGNLTSASDAVSGTYTFQYDGLDRLDKEQATLTGLNSNVILDHDYDQIGNRTNVRANIGGTLQANGAIFGGKADFQTTYGYDNLHRMNSVQQTGQAGGNPVSDKFVSFAYDTASQLTDIRRYAATTGVSNALVAHSHMNYDQVGRLTSLVHADDTAITWTGDFSASLPAGTIAAYQLDYDAGNRLERFSSWSDKFYADYDYDARNQLTKATYVAGAARTGLSPLPTEGTDFGDGQGSRYAYDSNGNRLQNLDADAALEQTSANGTDNRLQSDGTYRYEYDREGNRTKRTEIATGHVIDYAWDHRNRLLRITERSSASGTVVKQIDYTYDVFDRRISKAIDNDGVGAGQAYRDVYVYDGQHIALEFRDNDAGGSAQPQISHRYLHGPSVDMILADERAGGSVLWPLADHLGSVRDLVNSSGEVQNHIVYDAFGNIASESNAAIDHIFGYTGREGDEESHLTYYRRRYYDAETGRFISNDPIGFAGDPSNQYRYADNAPTNATDPLGLKAMSVTISFVSDAKTQAAAWYLYLDSEIHVTINIKKSISWSDIVKVIDKQLGSGNSIGSITFSGHGSQGSVGPLSGTNINNSNHGIQTLLQYLKSRLAADNDGIRINACNVASGSAGKQFIEDLSNITGTSVVAWDDWYAIVPHGKEWTAVPGKPPTETDDTGRRYSGSWLEYLNSYGKDPLPKKGDGKDSKADGKKGKGGKEMGIKCNDKGTKGLKDGQKK